MIAVILAVAAGLGVHLLSTPPADRPTRPTREQADAIHRRVRSLCRRRGVEAGTAELVRLTLPVALVGLFAGDRLFGAVAPALALAVAGACTPFALLSAQGQRRGELSRDAWPQLIEEIRVLATSVGRSIPQAFFEAGQHAPEPLASAFRSAHREWLLTTDFARTLDVLKEHLADPTADAVCETLLIANQVGGTDLDKRLQALAEDRIADSAYRKDARAKQAGVRFARRFVLIVPLGMAGVGMTIGSGRAAYATPQGQAAVLTSFGLICACWVWAGRLLKLPTEPRVFLR